MVATPETPESKPKTGFKGLLGQVKSAVSKAMPANMDELKNKVKSSAEAVSTSVSENLKKVDMAKINDKIDKIKESVKSASEKTMKEKDKKNNPK